MRIVLPLLALLCTASVPACAQNYPAGRITGTGGGFSGSGTFVATQNSDGSYTIDSLTGDANTGIGGLIAPGGFNGNDNLLFPGSGSQVDGGGFAFTDLQGDTGFQVDIFSTDGNGDYSGYLLDSDGFSETIPVTFTLDESGPAPNFATGDGGSVRDFSFSIGAEQPDVASTPEPSSVILLGSGLLCVCGFAGRRYRSA